MDGAFLARLYSVSGSFLYVSRSNDSNDSNDTNNRNDSTDRDDSNDSNDDNDIVISDRYSTVYSN